VHDRAREQIRVVSRSAQHLSSLIDGILDISKIEAGRLHLSRDEVRLIDFLDQLVAMLWIQAAEKGLEFVFRRETGRLFELIAKLKSEGVGIIYVSHRMREIRALADRITVLRDGRLVKTWTPTALQMANLSS
jgi:signal transduction histidine kinase